MNKLLIFTLMFLIVGVSGVIGACVTPVENLNVNESMTLCGGQYVLNDTLIAGVLQFNCTSCVINCNNTELIGNGTGYGSAISTESNSIFQGNCTFRNYQRGIQMNTASNVTIRNMNILNASVGGIYFFRGGLNIIEYNLIDGLKYSQSVGTYANISTTAIGNGIYNDFSTLSSDGNIFRYNNITRMKYGIYLSGTNSTQIYGNNISYIDSTGYAISLYRRPTGVHPDNFSNNNIVRDNNIYYGGWDCLQIIGKNNLIYNNTVQECVHHGIDTLYDDTSLTTKFGTNNSFYNNNIIDTIFDDYLFNTSFIAVFLAESSSNNLYNNYLTGQVRLGYGDGSINNQAYNNTILCNSTLFLTDATCLYGGINATFKNNIVYLKLGNTSNMGNIGSHIQYLKTNNTAGNSDSFNLFDNTYFINSGSINLYIQALVNNTVNVNESITSNFYTDYSNTYFISHNYSGRKNFNFNTFNYSIAFINQLSQSPYNDVKNVSTSSILASNVNNYSLTLSSGQSIEVGDFPATLNISVVPSSQVANGWVLVTLVNTNHVLQS